MTIKPPPSTKRREPTAAQADGERDEFLTRSASSVGMRWAVGIRRGLERDGRQPAGGFPGTVSELSRHLAEFFHVELRRASMTQLSAEERARSTRIAYAAARKDWLSHHVAEPNG